MADPRYSPRYSAQCLESKCCNQSMSANCKISVEDGHFSNNTELRASTIYLNSNIFPQEQSYFIIISPTEDETYQSRSNGTLLRRNSIISTVFLNEISLGLLNRKNVFE